MPDQNSKEPPDKRSGTNSAREDGDSPEAQVHRLRPLVEMGLIPGLRMADDPATARLREQKPATDGIQ